MTWLYQLQQRSGTGAMMAFLLVAAIPHLPDLQPLPEHHHARHRGYPPSHFMTYL